MKKKVMLSWHTLCDKGVNQDRTFLSGRQAAALEINNLD
jgi:hypothetical protein